MLESLKQVGNPLTVIAMFAALAEVSGTAVLPFLAPQAQGLFVWFVMGFPILLVLLFFGTLNFNHRVLYAPTDYREDKSFLAAINDNKIEGAPKGIIVDGGTL